MDYTQISFTLTPDNEAFREILIALLSAYDFESFTETETNVEAYWPGLDFSPEILETVGSQLPFGIHYTIEQIPDQNWNEVWEKNYFKPLLIGGKCLIRAPFHTDYPQAELELVIEPKMAFGTGNHETTTLMAETILEQNYTGMTVLDMGCGTGILAMLASLRGAEHVTAIDIDHWSFESTVENARLNNINNLEAQLGDASLLGTQQFDVVFANIHKNVIVNDLPAYRKVLKPGGQLLLSGFYQTDVEDILNVARPLGLEQLALKENNNWVVLVMRNAQNE